MVVSDSEYGRWLNELTLDDVRALFKQNDAQEVLYKRLPPNANSKNQVYLGADLGQLGKIPSGEVIAVESVSAKPMSEASAIFRALLSLSWITPEGQLVPAPHAKLIAYPQYPEVRFSGFLKGCRSAPSFLFDKERRGQDDGRVLMLGIRDDEKIVALALPPESVAARQLSDIDFHEPYGALSIMPLRYAEGVDALGELLAELCRLHRIEWTPSRRLDSTGTIVPCNSTNCAGYTLEAFLGIRANGDAIPDFRGWEVKSRSVPNSLKPGASTVTLFTPNPDGGLCAAEGAKAFIRAYGFPATDGTPDRLNVSGRYCSNGAPHHRTGLRLILDGYDTSRGKINAAGAIRLVDRTDREAASWSFSKLMDHWKIKHAQAAYVPSQTRMHPERSYRYGNEILLGEGALFGNFLKAVSDGRIYYDPGIHLERASSDKAVSKVRHQIRVRSRDLGSLYTTTRTVFACADRA